MKHKHRVLAAIAAALIVAAAGCSNDGAVSAADAPVKMEPTADPDVFTADGPQQFPLVKAELRRVFDGIEVNGVVAADVSRTVPVTSLAGGRVVEIDARLGDDVRQGQLLVKINSSDLGTAFADFEKAVSQELLSHRAQERARDLYEHGAIAQRDLDAAEDAERKAQVDLRAAAERIRILGGRPDQPTPVVELRAPVSGTIIDQQVQVSGGVKSIDNSPNLFTIADLSEVWVLCDVYENNLGQVRVGDSAQVRFVAYPGRVFRARVSNISSLLDPNTRTAKVRLQMPNYSRELRPGMFATAAFSSQAARERVAIPASAVLRLHDRDWVFRCIAPNRFRRQPIESDGASPGGYQFVTSGLRAGEEVVRDALQFSAAVEK